MLHFNLLTNEPMKKIEQLKAQQAQEIAKLEREIAIRAMLPVEPRFVHDHKDHVGLSYAKDKFPARYTLAEAIAIMEQFPNKVESEHWKNGCCSVRPLAINSSAKNERATMDGASLVEVRLNAGKGYDSHRLLFWAMVGETLAEVSIEITPPWKWIPQTRFRYDSHGHCIESRVSPVGIGEDIFRKWWSPEGSYQLSYYWAEVDGFRNIAALDANQA